MKLLVLTVVLFVCVISKSEQKNIWDLMEKRENVNHFEKRESEERADKDEKRIVERAGCKENARICALNVKWGRCSHSITRAQCPCACKVSGRGSSGRGSSGRGSSGRGSSGRGNGGSTSQKNKSNTGLSGAESIMLKEHNIRRGYHGVPPLTYDTGLAKTAKSWCTHLAVTNTWGHWDQKNAVERVGENLYYSVGRDPAKVPAVAVKKWYDEIELYDFNNPGFSGATGHFTQVVWKDSKKLGCHVTNPTQNSAKKVYACCHYSPPGNYLNEYRDNVPRKMYS